MPNILKLKQELLLKTTMLNRSSDNVEINRLVEELIIHATGAEYASIWMYKFPLLIRSRRDAIKEISIEKKSGLLYECFAKKESLIYNYLTSEKGYVPEIDNPDGIKIKTKMMIPLIYNNDFIGIATAYSSIKKIEKISHDDLKAFLAIAPFIIDSVQKMKKNSTFDKVPEASLSFTAKRETDVSKNLDKNLNELQESLLDIKAPSEMLQYVSNIVHDIRTPANGLLGFLEILQEQIKDSRLQEYVSHAKNSALLINELTTSILDGVAQKREPSNKEPKTVNTVKFFSDISDIFSANMFKKNIHYNIFIDPHLPKEIELDSMKTKRVIMNLISNASKFTPENGFIEFSVRYRKKEKKLHIFVKDSGIGIAKEKQKDIFKAFTQAQENTKAIYGGTGLGLSICADYVKEMGGKLSVESKVNAGSTFYFDLPMELEAYAHQPKATINPQTNVAILMSQENSYIANNIARYLVKIGLNVDKIKAIAQLDQASKETTHLLCFENKLSDNIFSYIKEKEIKTLVIEENFLSLNVNELNGAMLISQYSYFGSSLYCFVNDKAIPRVLIVEDDDISIALIKSMLENEYCEIDIAKDAEEGLKLLMQSIYNQTLYNIVYTDHNLPKCSGASMLHQYKEAEKDLSLQKTLTVAISGDSKETLEFDYDHYATKPFNKQEIVSLLLSTIRE